MNKYAQVLLENVDKKYQKVTFEDTKNRKNAHRDTVPDTFTLSQVR